MDAKFVWKDEYAIGVERIDKEHQQLFKIINRIFALSAEKKDDQWSCREGIKYFKSHAITHFADEEAYMASIGYPGLERHKHIHDGFRVNTLPALEQELEQSDYAPESVDHFLGVCAGWLIGHTLTEDRAIVGEGPGAWEKRLPRQELEAVKKVIVQQLFNMFRLESQLISDAYNGEKFGRGMYYRLVYGAPQGEEQEILLALEEKLLINTVGKAMGIQTGKLDSMLINGARYAARQFVGRVRESFDAGCGYELKEENLLSYEQFQKAFQRERPQISLLFNTGGAGYFAYCVIAPDLLEKGVGTAIEPRNVMEEVERYIRGWEEERRVKVLVVDDSATIRQGIKSLLEKDYEVALAESGLGAIRAIMLDRPDLVLLDYEMPVCDGRQTLEMLRAEEAYADLPVVFLTGRSDPETVRKVMPLRPAGYLLKNLKPAEIKEKVDAFIREGMK